MTWRTRPAVACHLVSVAKVQLVHSDRAAGGLRGLLVERDGVVLRATATRRSVGRDDEAYLRCPWAAGNDDVERPGRCVDGCGAPLLLNLAKT